MNQSRQVGRTRLKLEHVLMDLYDVLFDDNSYHMPNLDNISHLSTHETNVIPPPALKQRMSYMPYSFWYDKHLERLRKEN